MVKSFPIIASDSLQNVVMTPRVNASFFFYTVRVDYEERKGTLTDREEQLLRSLFMLDLYVKNVCNSISNISLRREVSSVN